MRLVPLPRLSGPRLNARVRRIRSSPWDSISTVRKWLTEGQGKGVRRRRTPSEDSLFGRALSRNLDAERFAIDAYRRLAAQGENYDKATLRLVKVALAVEEEHAEILTAIIENLRNLNGAMAG
jgi:rubrerythrin